MLREIADAQSLGHDALTAARRQCSADRFQQRRLARTVRAEQPDAIAREDRPVEVGKHWRMVRRVAVAQIDVLETHQLPRGDQRRIERDRKSTRLNSSHMSISYAVFCLKKKKKPQEHNTFHSTKPRTPASAMH